MFSGKTERLISLCTAHHFANHRIKAFKPANDTRYDETFITSHSRAQWLATPIDMFRPCDMPLDIIEDNLSKRIPFPDVIAIDEAQFFDASQLITTIETFLYVDGLTVIVSGLSQDSDGKPFGAMPHLLAIADDIIHLKSVCAKSKKIGAATRTYRKDQTNTNQVAVGGAEMYEPRSFEAWLENRK
jgi:thymidine kinase